MIDAPGFDSWQSMQSSDWLQHIRDTMQRDQWPSECVRCQDIEKLSEYRSVRQSSLTKHDLLRRFKSDYVILGGVLDNICNSACQSCNAGLSTKIGSLSGRDYTRIDNSALLDRVPWSDIVELDINGGEPTASPAYARLLGDPPPNVKIVRVNTNGSRLLPGIQSLLDRGLFVIITLSLDGTNLVHDYVRWPIVWSTYCDTVEQYSMLAQRHRNIEVQAWTTVHALNAADMPNIVDFADQHGLSHSWAWLRRPLDLDAGYQNTMTLRAKEILAGSLRESLREMSDYVASLDSNQDQLDQFISRQDHLRNINIRDYL